MQPERRKFTVIVFCKPLVREDTADGGPPLNLARENNHKPRNSACCSLLAGVLSILVLLPTRECNAQPLGSFGGSVVPGTATWGGYVIPDVNNKLSLASLLYNRSVATNLGLSAEDIDLINGYLEQNGGSFQSIAFIRMRSISQRKTEDELLAELAALRTKSAEFLEELIAPRQWARLRQMAYQVEVGRIGLANALTGGRLGADVGVDEQQTELIQIKAGEAEARAEEDIVRVLTELQDNVLAAITPGQRRQAKLLLGGPIVFQEELASSWKVEIPGWMESGKENN